MSEPDIQKLKDSMMPVFESLVYCLFAGDYGGFLEHHPPTPRKDFDQAVAILKPLGEPLRLEYVTHVVKVDKLKMLCKVSYSDTVEELLWDFNLSAADGEFRLINLGFDK